MDPAAQAAARDGPSGTRPPERGRGGGREVRALRAFGRSLGSRAIVAVAAGQDGDGIGHIPLLRVPDGSAANLEGFIVAAVGHTSGVRTDAWHSYFRLGARGKRHEAVFTGKDAGAPDRALPRMHRVAALLKRCLLGAHQGAVKHAHLYH